MVKVEFIRLRSATLVETIIALVIILVIFAITAVVLIRTNSTSFSIKKLRAAQLIDQFADETEKEKSFFSDEKVVGSFKLQKQIEENSFKEKIVILKFSIMDNNGRLIAYQNRIFRE